MFQVVHNKCTLHIQASNCVQEKEWLDTLTRLIQLNQSSADKGLCYDDNSKYLITPDLSIRLDPDRELERILCLFVSNQTNMQTIIEACEKGFDSVKIWKGFGKTHPSQFVIEDARRSWKILSQLNECLNEMNWTRQRYLESIHGTEKKPIDVDSYCNGNSI